MLSLNFKTPAETLSLSLPATTGASQAGSDSAALPSVADQIRQGVEVLLSPEAQKAAKAGGKDADIDDSNLPKRIKDQLKMIRSIQERIGKRMRDMQAFMSDRSLAPKVRQAKIRQMQMEIAAMTNSLMLATYQLNQAMQEMKLSLDDRALAGTLVSPQNIQS
ncbi:hypothetical protein ACIPL1_20695 [Pseudomonas sp. NPDC090202]|uniref:hypothetical protein n=1 Tax=unclassified Pseudomonas TaxID=196821 RepID=UPI0037FD65F8